jgi:DNA polymerase elongation subunit (family B)
MTRRMSLTFQVLGSTTRDEHQAFVVTLFGCDPDGKSVSLDVTGFRPYFYVELPSRWTAKQRSCYQIWLLSHLPEDDQRTVTTTVEHHKSFWDFTNNEMFPFLKIQAQSKAVWTRLRNIVQDADTALPIPYEGTVLRVFESNIDPMLRFFHLRELKPAGWVTVPTDQWDEAEEAPSSAARQLTADWMQVGPASEAQQLTAAPLKIMSWDIECTSSHGDFPLATKTWRKTAREMVAAGLYKSWDATQKALRKAILPSTPVKADPLSRIFLPAGPTTAQSFEKAMGKLAAAWSGLSFHSSAETDDLVETLDRAFVAADFPLPEGDPIIQIGCVLYTNGKPVRKDIFVLGSVARLPDQGGAPTHTHSCANEAALIRGWCRLISQLDPDIMMGYNIFGFDDKYVWDRAEVNRCGSALSVFSRITGKPVRLQEKFLSSSAMGDNTFYVISGEGRLHIDLLAYVRRNAVLDSYSLDNVTATFMSGGVQGAVALAPASASATASAPEHPNTWVIKTKSTKGTMPGRYIVLLDAENDHIGDKLEVIAVEPKALYVRPNDGADFAGTLRDHGSPPVRWSQAKDDVSPQDIFRLHAGGPSDRAKVARYCIQDCDLVMELFQKLEVLNNSIAMANVCWVPVEFIFTRGQGIKSESLVFYECRKEGQLIPVLQAPPRRQETTEGAAGAEAPDAPQPEILINADDNEGYEGAIVLDPLTGIYLDDDPVAALDFSSLYPSSIISENLSHDSVVWVKDYTMEGELVAVKEGSDRYDNLPGWDYLEVDYDILKPDPAESHKKHPRLTPQGRRVCRFAQHRDPATKSTLPKILQKLLSARKATRKLAEKETDDFRKALLDAQQLAYKLTANSLYGQLGSNTSKIRRKCLAASTTGHGRQQLLFSKACIERAYGPTAGDPRCSAICVYGDTDSVFIAFRPRDPATGARLTGKAAQAAAKELAEEAGHRISGALKPPHDFEFDKMFRCFCLLSKKRYVGDMTEGGLEDGDYHRKSMGIVMKRRDNAPIVKTVYGGAIEAILAKRDIQGAFTFVQQATRDLLAGKYPMKRLTITKSLRAEYKTPTPPAHKVLAERMGKRDPGNKPSSNDRIPFVYVRPPPGVTPPTSQGERIETPTYIREKGLQPDYVFYITNQIAKPVAQVFGLVVDKLPGFRRHMLAAASKDPVTATERVAEELLFGAMLREAERKAKGQKSITSFFTVASK